jgi:type IV pilus assembly protein PilW
MNMINHHTYIRPPHVNSKGFSLVELMVALVITLILLAGIGQIFLSSKKSFTIQDSLARIQENGRFAMETLAQDLRRVGYWGGNAEVEKIFDNTPAGVSNGNQIAEEDGSCTNNNFARMLTHKVFGKDDNRTSYDCLPSSTHVGDILTVRYAAPWLVGGTTTPAFSDNMIYMRSSLFRGALFLGSAEASNPVPGTIRTAELVARAYFIHPSLNSVANKCASSDSVPSLYRLTLDRSTGGLTSEEVAYGVENFQVQYGLDTDAVADNSVDQYVDAMAPTDSRWDQVIAVRLWLLVRAECPETGFTNTNTYVMGNQNFTPTDINPNDAYRRQLYTSTIMLRNR